MSIRQILYQKMKKQKIKNFDDMQPTKHLSVRCLNLVTQMEWKCTLPSPHMPCQDYKYLDEVWSLIQHGQSDPIT